MANITITIPDDLAAFVRGRVAQGGYADIDDYIRDLIRVDQGLQVEEKIDALLREGIDSGAPIEITPGHWESKKRTLAGRIARGGDRYPDGE